MRAVAAMGAGALLLVSSVAALITIAGSFRERSDEGGVLVATLAALAAGALFLAYLQRTGGLVALGLGASIACAALFDLPADAHGAAFVGAGALVAALGAVALVVPPADGRAPLGRARSVGIATMCFVGAACLVVRVFEARGAGWVALAVGVVAAGVAVLLVPDAAAPPDDVVVEVVSPPGGGSLRASAPPRESGGRVSARPSAAAPATAMGRRPLTAPPASDASSSSVGSSGSSAGMPSTWLREIARAPSVAVARAPLSEEDPLLGARVGPYEIGAELGRGGMSVVYRATDTRTGAAVALKILPPSRANDRIYRTRFVREVAAMRGVSHPNVVAVLDASGEDAPVFYLAMELVDGPSLRAEVARRGRFDAREAAAVIAAIADALGAGHAVGVVHRDVKPENILLAGGRTPKLADFGLARVDLRSAMKGATALTRAGDVLGTIAYMAPEQLRGEPAGAEADVFACGLVLAELLTGRSLFARPTAEATMRALQSFTTLPEEVRAAAPPPIVAVLERALAVDPKLRHPTGADLASALRAANRAG